MTETLEDMLRFDLQDRGVTDERVLNAFRRIDRARFAPAMAKNLAYEDRALIISHGQTLSQPYIVGLMTQALRLTGTERVLEIGTGSGFQAAILAVLAKEVYTVERIEYLATTAEDRVHGMGLRNVHFRLGDGAEGWPEFAPFDRILVTAACADVPQALFDQLKPGGMLVVPVGPPEEQELLQYTKKNGRWERASLGPCVFVPFVRSN